MAGIPAGDIYYKGKALNVPPEIAHGISLRAAEIVRRTAPRGEHNSRSLIQATHQRGQIGIYIPPAAIHLLYLDRGIKPFLMTALEGKTIPIRTPNGIIFRRAKNVGQTKIISRNERGQIIYSKLAWRYPGVEPMNFIEPAFKQAIQEYFLSLQNDDMMAALQKMEGPVGEFFSRFKKNIGMGRSNVVTSRAPALPTLPDLEV